MSGIRLQPFPIVDLARQIAEGRLSLPEFQRDFDWTDEQVASLIATVIKGWPAGSLLLMEGREELFFREREFEDAPNLAAKVDLIVLDGQQRLTGLFQAIYDTGRFVYAINAEVLRADATVDEIEEGVKSVRREEWDAEYRDTPWPKQGGWIPLYALRSPADYFTWRDSTVQHAQMLQGDKDRLAVRLADAYREGLEAFHRYDFPSIIVQKEVEPAAVARIFERVNTTGIPLTTFDLMVARTFKEGWNLRDRWDAALAEYPLFPLFFGENGLPALQVIALRYGDGVRQSDVLKLEAPKVRRHWRKALRALDAAVQILYRSCGVNKPAWLPYPALMLTLAGVAIDGYDLDAEEEKVRQWFFSRVFGQRFDVAANTVTLEEVAELKSWFDGKAKLKMLRLDADVVAASSRRRRGALWRGFMCVLAAEGAIDLHGEEEVELNPISLLERKAPPGKGEEPLHLRTLGFCLGTRQEARDLSHEGVETFNRYLAELPTRVGSHVAKRQLLPVSSRSDEEFLEERLDLLSSFLDRVTGAGLEWEED